MGEISQAEFEKLTGRTEPPSPPAVEVDEEASEEGRDILKDFEPADSEEDEAQKFPLVFVLSRHQTKAHVESAIIHGVKTLAEKRDLIEGVNVPIEGFEGFSLHPSQIKEAKRKYAEAIDCGLVGFLLANGFVKHAQEVYCIAYAQAQLKGKGTLRFKNINMKHMSEITRKSAGAYLDLLERNGVADEIIAKLQLGKEAALEE